MSDQRLLAILGRALLRFRLFAFIRYPVVSRHFEELGHSVNPYN